MAKTDAPMILQKCFGCLPQTERGKPIVLNGDPKGRNFLYCNNKVIIRDINDTSICDVYHEHAKSATVAKYSPSGFYICSGDITGKIRIWDTVNPEHMLKYEYHVLGGAVKDLDWDVDSKRLIIAGEGRELYAKPILWDSGSGCGEISGHTKAINSVSMKQSRPYKAVTGSEDYQVIFYDGVPFKYNNKKTDHTNFVNCVRYSPDGSKFITGGSDGQLLVYDGKTSEFISSIPEKADRAHKGGVYAICFNDDGSKLLSVSGDKTAKIWDLEEYMLETDFILGPTMSDMQVGCLWQGNHIITVSLSGYINYLDQHDTTQPKKIVKGHNKAITALAVNPDGSRLYTASFDGLIISWDSATSDCEDIKGKGHTNQVSDMVLDGDTLITVGIDDVLMFTNAASLEYSAERVKLDTQPAGVDSVDGTTVVVTLGEAVVFRGMKNILSTTKLGAVGKCVSIKPGASEVAVGTDKDIQIYEIDNGVLTHKQSLTTPGGEIGSVHYSPDGAFLAVGSKNKVLMYDTTEWKEGIAAWGDSHTAKVTTVRWSPDSRRFASGSIDSHISLWEHGKFTGKKPTVKAHPTSVVNKLRWLNNNTIVTVGQDANTKIWAVSD